MNENLINKIKNNNIFTHFSESDYKQVDEMGFDLLHYAIFFGDIKTIKKIMQKSYLLPNPVINNRYSLVYDYSFIAAVMKKESVALELEDASLYVRDSVRIYEILSSRYRAIENMISVDKRMKNRYLRLLESANSSQKVQIKQKINQINNSIDIHSRILINMKDDIYEAEVTINNCKILYQKNLLSFKSSIISAPAIIKLLLYIYEHIELYDSTSRMSYEYEGYIFGIPDSLYSKFVFYSEKNTEYKNKTEHSETRHDKSFDSKKKYNEKEKSSHSETRDKEYKKFNKPNGDCWFSKKAWGDIDQLRREYRLLAKQYHPDNHPDKIDIFMSIQAERAVILERLKK